MESKFTYKTEGVCSQRIDFVLEDGLIKDIVFLAGCNGNLTGISRLLRDMPVDIAIEKLKGIKCGMKNSSCPDQAARALEAYKMKQQGRV